MATPAARKRQRAEKPAELIERPTEMFANFPRLQPANSLTLMVGAK
jgi:hypothetical protein